MIGWWFTDDDEEKALTFGTHSPGCKMVGTAEDPNILYEDLDIIDQDYLLQCSHSSHSSVKWLMQIGKESPNKEKSKQAIEDGRLF